MEEVSRTTALASDRCSGPPAFEAVLLAGASGVFRCRPPATYTAEGEIVGAGQTVAVIETFKGAVPVISAEPGFVTGWFRRDGDAVRAGEPVTRLQLFRRAQP